MWCRRFHLAAQSLGAVTLVGATLVGQAYAEPRSDDPCRVKIGRERPAGCTPWSKRSAARPIQKQVKQTKPPTPPRPKVSAPRDPRVHEGLTEQRRRLLIAELARLERLVAATRPRSPDRAALIHRLAEGYAELTAIAERQKIRAEVNAAEAKKELEEPVENEPKTPTAPPDSASPYPQRL